MLQWKSDTNMTEAHNCNTYDSGYGHSVSTTNLSTKLLKKQNCYKKARKQTPIISNGPIVGGASSSSSTADFERPFGCFSNSKFQESLAKNTLRKPRPGERFYLMSESGSPLSNLDHARSMPALYLPLEDGKTVALTTDISFSSLDMRFKRDMEKFKTKFNSVLGNISQVNVDNGLK